MSAICGIVNLNGEPVDPGVLPAMVASSPYRGPDGVGYWREKNVGLAHMAFHVTAESVREHQPLEDVENGLVLVADVRLDNRDELIDKLDDLPENPTDSDLLLAFYRKWGSTCVEHFLGDFAFAVWDSKNQSLFLARDPMGAYGFSYYHEGSCFLFASETTAILDFLGDSVEIDEIAVGKHLVGVALEQDETFFQSVFHCPPAHYMIISASQFKRYRYWDIDPDFRIHYRDDNEYTDHFVNLITEAVSCRIRSIGPVGISLSGGCDSTLVAAVSSRLLASADLPQSRIKSFSYIFDDFPECDERRYIQTVVEQYNLDAIYIQADGKTTFSDIGQLPVYTGFFSYDCYAQLPIAAAQTARQHECRVLLDGLYGDTLFDMPSYFVADAIGEGRWVDLFDWFKQHRDHMDWKNYVIQCGLRPLIPMGLKRVYRNIRPGALDFLNPGVAPARIRKLRTHLQDRPPSTTLGRLPPGRQQRYRSLFSSTWSNGHAFGRGYYGNLLGIERISPYFDRRLVEYALAIPPDQVSRPGRHRFLQKNAMRRLLPPPVCDRQEKTSYEPLLVKGLQKHRHSVVQPLAENSLVVRQGWVRPDWFHKQLNLEHPDQNGFPLSMCLHLELWLRAVEKARMDGKWSEAYRFIAGGP